jgi:hypothetical protein
MPTYEIVKNSFNQDILKKTNEDDTVWWIPCDPANSDYQEYLKSLEAEQSTPIDTEDEE